MSKLFRIGTRGSKLALWQSEMVERQLQSLGQETTRVIIKTQGDLDQQTPLDKFDAPGVFTSMFDQALLQGEVDIAVHSLKDYPTRMPGGIVLGAYFRRGNPVDTLVLRVPIDSLELGNAYTVATSSSRRRAQWLRRFPGSATEQLRGNVPTRLAKLYESNWAGAIFAKAGLQRLGIQPPHAIDLGWMIPAPGQAVVTAACRADDTRVLEKLAQLNDANTQFCVTLERAFMHMLGGGCEAPIGALATVTNGTVYFKGSVLSEDGAVEVAIHTSTEYDDPEAIAAVFADKLRREGAEDLLKQTV